MTPFVQSSLAKRSDSLENQLMKQHNNRRPTRCNLPRMTVLIFLMVVATEAHSLPTNDGLQVWLQAGTGISVTDGEDVLSWSDASGNGRSANYNALNGFGEQAPTFDASNSGIGGEASVHFNNLSALELDLDFLVGSDYTIFVVNGRDRAGAANFYLAGDTAAANSSLTLGYEQPNLLRQAHFLNDLDGTVEEYIDTPIWAIDGFRFSQTEGRSLFHNGMNIANDMNTLALQSNTGTTLGHFRAFGNAFWFEGDIAELAVFDRALNDAEVQSVQSDLAIRYGLANVPEPSTSILLSLGLIGLSMIRKFEGSRGDRNACVSKS